MCFVVSSVDLAVCVRGLWLRQRRNQNTFVVRIIFTIAASRTIPSSSSLSIYILVCVRTRLKGRSSSKLTAATQRSRGKGLPYRCSTYCEFEYYGGARDESPSIRATNFLLRATVLRKHASKTSAIFLQAIVTINVSKQHKVFTNYSLCSYSRTAKICARVHVHPIQ